MMRLTRDFGDTMQRDAVPAVSSDVVFASSRCPNYRIGANNQIIETKDDPKVLSMKEVVAREIIRCDVQVGSTERFSSATHDVSDSANFRERDS